MGFNVKGQKKGGHRGIQLTMRDSLVIDLGPHIKAAMSEVIRGCSLSRDEVVEEMNRLARIFGISCNGKAQEVTPAILDKWVAPGANGYHIPLRILPLFCRATGSNLPLEVYAAAFQGASVISREDKKILEWARAEIDSRQARKRSRRIAQEVGIE